MIRSTWAGGWFFVAILFYSSNGHARCANLFHETSTLSLESLIEIMLGRTEPFPRYRDRGGEHSFIMNEEVFLVEGGIEGHFPMGTELLDAYSGYASRTGSTPLNHRSGSVIEMGELYRVIAAHPDRPSPPRNRWIDPDTGEVRIPDRVRTTNPELIHGEIREWPIAFVLAALTRQSLYWNDPTKKDCDTRALFSTVIGFLIGSEPVVETSLDGRLVKAGPSVTDFLLSDLSFFTARDTLLSQYPELTRFKNALPQKTPPETLEAKVEPWLHAMQHILGGVDSLPLVMPFFQKAKAN